MSDEHCDATGPGGVHCTLPPNHGGENHQFEIELPEHVAKLVASYIDDLDGRIQDMDKHIRRMRWARWVLLGAAAFNIFVSVYYFVLILALP